MSYSQERLGIGIIGYGIGKLYAAVFNSLRNYYTGFPPIELIAIATASQASAEQAKQQFGFHLATQDYRQLLADPAVNVVVIATPNSWHYPMLMDSLETGKAIYVDKPLANSLAQAKEILSLAKQRQRDAQMIFEIRFCPALQRAFELIRSGQLGEITSFRAHYYRSSYVDPEKSLRWKASAEERSSGALGDLASHLIDLISWLVAPPERLSARLRTVITERPERSGSQTIIPVETDDHVMLQLELPGGVLGSIEAARIIPGTFNDMNLEIYGSRVSLRWNLMDANHLYIAYGQSSSGELGWRQIPTIQTYPDAFLPGWDVPAGLVRYHIASAASFIRTTINGENYSPSLEEGAQVQAVIEAAFQSAHQEKWVQVPSVQLPDTGESV